MFSEGVDGRICNTKIRQRKKCKMKWGIMGLTLRSTVVLISHKVSVLSDNITWPSDDSVRLIVVPRFAARPDDLSAFEVGKKILRVFGGDEGTKLLKGLAAQAK